MLSDSSWQVAEFNLNPRFYLRLMSTFAWIGLPMNLLGIFVTIRHTPDHLKSIRAQLINSQVWATIQDFVLAFCIAPVFFLPMPAGYPTGLFASLGISTEIQFCLAVILLCANFSSVSHLTLYKWQLVLPNHHLCKIPGKLKMAVSSCLYFSLPVFCLFSNGLFEDQDEQKKLLAKNYPIYDPVTRLPNSLVFFLPNYGKFAQFLYVFGAIFGIYLTLMIFFTWSSMIQQRAFDKYSTVESGDGNTKIIVRSIKIQLAIMMGTLVKPGIFTGLVIFVHIWNAQELVESAFFLVSCYGLIGTISMFWMEENYRLAAKGLIRRLLGRNRGDPSNSMDGVKYRTNEPDLTPANSQVTILET